MFLNLAQPHEAGPVPMTKQDASGVGVGALPYEGVRFMESSMPECHAQVRGGHPCRANASVNAGSLRPKRAKLPCIFFTNRIATKYPDLGRFSNHWASVSTNHTLIVKHLQPDLSIVQGYVQHSKWRRSTLESRRRLST